MIIEEKDDFVVPGETLRESEISGLPAPLSGPRFTALNEALKSEPLQEKNTRRQKDLTKGCKRALQSLVKTVRKMGDSDTINPVTTPKPGDFSKTRQPIASWLAEFTSKLRATQGLVGLNGYPHDCEQHRRQVRR